ncbi:hypothetical protein BDV09DRAFT_51522 [Aspergillus tetrazonus]
MTKAHLHLRAKDSLAYLVMVLSIEYVYFGPKPYSQPTKSWIQSNPADTCSLSLSIYKIWRGSEYLREQRAETRSYAVASKNEYPTGW